ncbi:hypothetical protein GIW00_15165 [Pseudomonas syringae]|nr:hypothetical protein [Pseudomonas syringae]
MSGTGQTLFCTTVPLAKNVYHHKERAGFSSPAFLPQNHFFPEIFSVFLPKLLRKDTPTLINRFAPSSWAKPFLGQCAFFKLFFLFFFSGAAQPHAFLVSFLAIFKLFFVSRVCMRMH